MGFQNKFYSAKIFLPNSGNEHRINVSSDTPHWYIMDYLNRVGHYYGITSVYVGGERVFLKMCKMAYRLVL